MILHRIFAGDFLTSIQVFLRGVWYVFSTRPKSTSKSVKGRPPPRTNLLSSCIMNNIPGNDDFMQDKQGSTSETAFEVKADSRRDRFYRGIRYCFYDVPLHSIDDQHTLRNERPKIDYRDRTY
jgi:hypothetical protein